MIEDEVIDMKNNSKQKKNKKNLTLTQKIIIFIVLFLLLIIIYNINKFENYFISNINNNNRIIQDIKQEQKGNKISETKKEKKTIKSQKNFTNKKKQNKEKNLIPQSLINKKQKELEKELELPILSEINKKRTFEKRYPLPKEIKCPEHLRESGGLLDMMVFTSFLTKNITFFEFASGCSSIIAKYYAKKSYAVEGNKKWYDIGVKNGLKDNLLFRDLKCDGSGPLLSYPGRKSTMKDWKNFFQAYKKEYNADVIFIDGRFRVACALDVFSKIKNDTVLLLHECNRKQYKVIQNYYNLIRHWGILCMYQKKENISEIPLKIQKKYWVEKL